MVPAFLTAPRNLVIAGIAAAFATTASAPPALAWGAPEQNFVAGTATGLLFGAMIWDHPRQRAYRPAPTRYRYAPPPRYYAPPPRVVYVPAQPVHPTGIYASPAGRAFNSYNYNQRRRIQLRLKRFGYYHGAIDGAFGPATYNAVTNYAANTHRIYRLNTLAGSHVLYNRILYGA